MLTSLSLLTVIVKLDISSLTICRLKYSVQWPAAILAEVKEVNLYVTLFEYMITSPQIVHQRQWFGLRNQLFSMKMKDRINLVYSIIELHYLKAYPVG